MEINIIDNNSHFCQSFSFFLETVLNHKVKSFIVTKSSLSEEVISIGDIVLINLGLLDINSLEENPDQRSIIQNNKIIAFSHLSCPYELNQLFILGIKGFLKTSIIHSHIENAIERVYDGGYYFLSEVTAFNIVLPVIKSKNDFRA